MLKKIWDGAVGVYQAYKQDNDRAALEAVERRYEAAKEGFDLRTNFCAVGYGSYVYEEKVPVTPAQAGKIIAECAQTSADITLAMQARREKFGLKF